MTAKKRNTTPTGFLSKLSKVVEKNKSAQGFLEAHREYLLTGSLYTLTTPILIKADSGEIGPGEAISELMQTVFDHIQEENQKQLSALQDVQEVGKKKAIMLPVIAAIYDGLGNLAVMKSENGKEIDPEKGFTLGQDALRWVDRRLVYDANSGCYGEIVHSRVMLKGEPMKDVVSREDSFLRVCGEKKGPIMKRTAKGSSRLTSLMRVKESRSTFSGA